MSAQAHEIQGSDEWHAYRQTRGGASELAALMGCSPWFPATPYQLWTVKTGRAEVHEHAAMRRGAEMEGAAREYLEHLLGEVFEPQVRERGRLLASLDGQSFDGRAIIELKIPAAGNESDTWQYVARHGEPPEHYLWQCKQQLLVSGAQQCIFAVCDADDTQVVDALTCEVLYPTPLDMEVIESAWADFFNYLDSDTPPPMTERDVIERSDSQWAAAAKGYLEAKAALKTAEKAEKAARERLQIAAGERSAKGCGVACTRYFVAGGIDYKAALPAGIDVEPFRKPGRVQWRITETKES